jgi:DNA-binding MarR family transcriptional regulator
MTRKQVAGRAPRRLPPLLRRAWYGLNQAFRHRIAHLGITPDQYTILRWLREGDPRGLTQSQITALMASDPNTVAATLKRMESAGLLERRPHETDHRAHRVRLKPRGKTVFQRALKLALQLQDETLAALPRRRLNRFLADLELVADACGRAAEQSSNRAQR